MAIRQDPSAESIFYDFSDSGLLSDNVKTAIDELAGNTTVFSNVQTFVRVLVLELDSKFTIEMNSLARIINGSNQRTILVNSAVLDNDSILRIQSNAVATIEGV